MVDEELRAPMHYLLSRQRWLKSIHIPCPKCRSYMDVKGVKIMPKWLCPKCNNISAIEPIKNKGETNV